MSVMSGPYRDYAECGSQSDNDIEQQLVGIGIRPEEARRYVQGDQVVSFDAGSDVAAGARSILSAMRK